MKQEKNVICDLKVVRNENGLGIHTENIDSEFFREQLALVLESVLEELDDDHLDGPLDNDDIKTSDIVPLDPSNKAPFLYDFYTDEHGLHIDIACPDVKSMIEVLKGAHIDPDGVLN